MIRAAWVALNLMVATVPLSIVLMLGPVLRIPDSWYERIPRFWSRWMLWASGVTVEFHGAHHIAPDRPQVIAANHASWFDVLALAAFVPKRYRFIAKQELRRVPFFGPAWAAAGHIAIDRSDTQRAVASLDHARNVVQRDRSCIIIFPEGTRSADGSLLPFKKGTFMLAIHGGFDIVPAGIHGTREIMNRHSWRVRAGRIIVRFGEPVNTAAYGSARRDELIARVRSDIESLRRGLPPGSEEDHVRHHQHTRP